MRIRVEKFDGQDLDLSEGITLALVNTRSIDSIEIQMNTREGQKKNEFPIHACLVEYDGYADNDRIIHSQGFLSRETAIEAISQKGIYVPFSLRLLFSANKDNPPLDVLKTFGGRKEPRIQAPHSSEPSTF